MFRNDICRISIIDSELESVRFYRETLGLQFDLQFFDSISSFRENFEMAETSAADLIIVDPDSVSNGLRELLDFRNKLKSQNIDLPHYMIASSLRALKSIRSFYHSGACEFLSKPFVRDEALVRIERTLSLIRGQEIVILENAIDGVEIENLTYREHQILTVLLRDSQKSITRRRLLESVWVQITVHHKTLDVHLFNLRRKLRPNGYDIVYHDQTFSLRKLTPEEIAPVKCSS